MTTESDFQLEQLIEILIGAFVKRGIEHSSLDIPTESEHHGKLYTKEIKLKQGIEPDMAKKITKLVPKIQKSKFKLKFKVNKYA